MPYPLFIPVPRGCVCWLAGFASRVTLLWAARNAEPGQPKDRVSQISLTGSAPAHSLHQEDYLPPASSAVRPLAF